MTTERARKILKETAEGLTDKEVRGIIDRLSPLVDLAVTEAKEKFNLTTDFLSSYSGSEGGL